MLLFLYGCTCFPSLMCS